MPNIRPLDLFGLMPSFSNLLLKATGNIPAGAISKKRDTTWRLSHGYASRRDRANRRKARRKARR